MPFNNNLSYFVYLETLFGRFGKTLNHKRYWRLKIAFHLKISHFDKDKQNLIRFGMVNSLKAYLWLNICFELGTSLVLNMF